MADTTHLSRTSGLEERAMNQQKRVLFLSITSGQGHNAAAKAVKSYLEKKQVQCRILDTYTYLSRPVGKGVDKGYTFIARYRPEALEMIFRGYEENQSVEKSLPFKFADLQKRKLAAIFRSMTQMSLSARMCWPAFW